MTSSDNAALRRYYRSIRAALSQCTCKQRNRVLKDLKANVTAFLEADPQADFQKLQAHFGTPQQIASSYLADLTDEEVYDKLHIRNKVFKIVLIAVLAAVLLWLGAVGWAAIESNKADNGYFVTEIS